MPDLIMSYFENELVRSFKSQRLGVVAVGEVFKSAIGFPVDGRNRLVRGYLHWSLSFIIYIKTVETVSYYMAI